MSEKQGRSQWGVIQSKIGLGRPDKPFLVQRLTGELASIAEAQSLTRALAKTHYENFVVASLLLPREMRQPFYNVYAFLSYRR